MQAAVAVALVVASAACAAPAPPPPASDATPVAAGAGHRLSPPTGLACPRSRLTSYAGKVEALTLGPPLTRITLHTDWGTVEAVELRHASRTEAERSFLLHGAPFVAADWAAIERSPGVPLPGLRAIAWVCDDGRTPPVIDWRPGEPAVPAR